MPYRHVTHISIACSDASPTNGSVLIREHLKLASSDFNCSHHRLERYWSGTVGAVNGFAMTSTRCGVYLGRQFEE
jgi:hypothetical protein